MRIFTLQSYSDAAGWASACVACTMTKKPATKCRLLSSSIGSSGRHGGGGGFNTGLLAGPGLLPGTAHTGLMGGIGGAVPEALKRWMPCAGIAVRNLCSRRILRGSL